MKVMVLIGATRDGRQTPRLAKWVANAANNKKSVEAELVDLKDYELPFFNEMSPRYNLNRQPEGVTKKWLDKVSKFDAYIVVTPEYNHSIPAVLKNALDHIDWQVNRKPSTIVSHGSASGARAAMHLKEILSEIKSVPVPNSVAFHGLENISEEGVLNQELKDQAYGPEFALEGMLDELKWYSDALAEARAPKLKTRQHETVSAA